MTFRYIPLLLILGTTAYAADVTPVGEISAASYPSIQAALDANPNKMVFVPAGDHSISEKIRIRGDRAGLYGPGKIIQQSTDHPVIEIENATSAEVRDVTLTRPEGKMETRGEGILAIGCRDLVIENVRVIDNRSNSSTIMLRDSRNSRISRCLVRNYMRVSIDDRTGGIHWGYAFNCTDGTGIGVVNCVGTLIESNRIVEENLLPTRETKERYKLGDFVKRNPEKGTLTNQKVWDAGYVDSWRQGSGIVVTGPEVSDFTRIVSNHIENAGQGIDLHADHVIVSNNIVVNSFMGMKAMHGSRNVLITSNQFARNDLWAIGLMPGAAAHPEGEGKPANSDGGSIIANNIVSDFGHGDSHWVWGTERSPFKFDNGQEADDPPLSNVIIQGNLLYSSGPPRYKYAVIIAGGATGPQNLHFSNNLLPPGTKGECNVELPR